MSDTFRKTYKPLTENQKDRMNDIKNTAEELEKQITMMTNPDNGREMVLAKTKLEECIMWAVKGITK